MGARILAIEDDAGVGSLLRRGLGLAGHEVTLAADGAEGRAAWASAHHDLILLDIMLPDADGLSILAEQRAAGDTTPVVLLTARDEGDLRDRGAELGATAYLAKPFAYAELLDMVQRLVGKP